jgi:hypothetical protein
MHQTEFGGLFIQELQLELSLSEKTRIRKLALHANLNTQVIDFSVARRNSIPLKYVKNNSNVTTLRLFAFSVG